MLKNSFFNFFLFFSKYIIEYVKVGSQKFLHSDKFNIHIFETFLFNKTKYWDSEKSFEKEQLST